MKTFEEKLQSLTGKEVLKALIDGLENPVTRLDFMSFGDVREGICYGCGATNAICKLGGFTGEQYVPERDNLWSTYGSIGIVESLNAKISTIDDFESAIDSLRQGNIIVYNTIVRNTGYPNLELPITDMHLPALWDDNYKEDLHFYKEYYETV